MSGFWIARLLGPRDYGIWSAVSLVLAYGAYVEFGVLSAMGRDLPLYLGQNDRQNAAIVDGAARYSTIYGAIIASIVVIGISFSSKISSMMSFGLRTMAVVLVLQQIYTYHRIYLRSYNQFAQLSQQQLLYSIFNAVLSIVLVISLNLTGRMIAALIAQAAIVLYALSRNPWNPVPKFKISIALSLMRVGVPILVSGLVITMLTTIDRLMVITFLDETQLGYLGLGLLLVNVISLIPAMASQALYPRINFQYGHTGKNVEALRSYVLLPPVVLSCLLPLLIGPLYLMIPYVVKIFLPAYTPGIVAARIVAVGIYFYGILGLTDYFLVTTGKLKQYAFFGSIALLFNIVLDYSFIRMGYGIEGIALGGTLITYFLYSCVVIGYALSHYSKLFSVWIKLFSRLWAPFVYMLILLWSVEAITEKLGISSLDAYSYIVPSGKILLYIIGCFPLIYIAGTLLKLDLSRSSLEHLGIVK